MPSARSFSTAGRTMAPSSGPSMPSSPACGLRPATARRGLPMPKRLRRSRGNRSSCVDDPLGCQFRGHSRERDVDSDWHNAQPRSGQHHDRHRSDAEQLLAQRAEKLRMSRERKSDVAQRLFLDRIGHDGRGRSGAHHLNGCPDRCDDGVGCLRSRFGPVTPEPEARPRRHGSASGNASRASAGATLAVGISTPSGCARRMSSPASPMKRKGGTLSRACHAAIAMSGPIPAGSPNVRTSGGRPDRLIDTR